MFQLHQRPGVIGGQQLAIHQHGLIKNQRCQHRLRIGKFVIQLLEIGALEELVSHRDQILPKGILT